MIQSKDIFNGSSSFSKETQFISSGEEPPVELQIPRGVFYKIKNIADSRLSLLDNEIVKKKFQKCTRIFVEITESDAKPVLDKRREEALKIKFSDEEVEGLFPVIEQISENKLFERVFKPFFINLQKDWRKGNLTKEQVVINFLSHLRVLMCEQIGLPDAQENVIETRVKEEKKIIESLEMKEIFLEERNKIVDTELLKKQLTPEYLLESMVGMRNVYQLWRDGDVEGLLGLSAQYDDDGKAEMVKRNLAMATRIHEFLNTTSGENQFSFFFVGILHLVADNHTIIDLLNEKGWKLEAFDTKVDPLDPDVALLMYV